MVTNSIFAFQKEKRKSNKIERAKGDNNNSFTENSRALKRHHSPVLGRQTSIKIDSPNKRDRKSHSHSRRSVHSSTRRLLLNTLSNDPILQEADDESNKTQTTPFKSPKLGVFSFSNYLKTQQIRERSRSPIRNMSKPHFRSPKPKEKSRGHRIDLNTKKSSLAAIQVESGNREKQKKKKIEVDAGGGKKKVKKNSESQKTIDRPSYLSSFMQKQQKKIQDQKDRETFIITTHEKTYMKHHHVSFPQKSNAKKPNLGNSERSKRAPKAKACIEFDDTDKSNTQIDTTGIEVISELSEPHSQRHQRSIRDYDLNNIHKINQILDQDKELASHKIYLRNQMKLLKTPTQGSTSLALRNKKKSPKENIQFCFESRIHELQKYEFKSIIGKGSYGIVRLAHVKSHKNQKSVKVAVKIYEKKMLDAQKRKSVNVSNYLIPRSR